MAPEQQVDRQPCADMAGDSVRLPAATRDFILSALDETSLALSRTHGLRATRRLLVEEGTLLTQDNSFRINHLNHLLLVSLVRRMLSQQPDKAAGTPGCGSASGAPLP